MSEVSINRIVTDKPPHDGHDTFLRFGHQMPTNDPARTDTLRCAAPGLASLGAWLCGKHTPAAVPYKQF